MTSPSPRLVVGQSEEFLRWLTGLRDGRASTIVSARIARLRRGLRGDSRALGDGLSELRIDYGPGYRLYYVQRGDMVVLLWGGDKSSQSRDIARARVIAEDLDNGD